MTYKFLTLVIVVTLALPLWAQQPSVTPQKTDSHITGHIIDLSTGEHIPYATVVIAGTNIGAQSDSTGHYMLANVPSGALTIEASFLGYQKCQKTIEVGIGTTYVLHLELSPDPMELTELVITGNRYATKKRETSTIVNVTPPKRFEQTMAVNPAGVLDFQPGGRVEYNCGNCGVPQLRINGLSGQYSQVLLDSHPLFSSLGMVYGLEQIPSAMVERIEMVRGGGSALYGSNAIGGTVNIITKEPTTSLMQLSNQLGIIKGGAIDNNTSLNASIVSQDRKTGTYLFSMLRNRDPYDHNGDDLSEIPMLKSQTVGMRSYMNLSRTSKITAEYHYIHEFRRGGDNFDHPAHESNLAEQLEHNIIGGSLSYDFTSKSNKTHVNTYVSTQYIDRNSYFGTCQNLNAYGKTTDLTFNAGAQWSSRLSKLLFMPAVLSAGVDYIHDGLHDQMLGYNRDLTQITNTVGLYAQNEWVTDNLSLLIGGRIDKHSLIERPIVSPRANLRYAPNTHVTLRASYARGFRAPQTYDEDLHVGAVGGEVALISVSPSLIPEYSHTVNLSFDYWTHVGNWQINFLAEGFYTTLENVFALEENGHDALGNLLLLRVNAPGATVAGVNAETRLAWKQIFSLQAGYTFQQSRYKEPFSWTSEPDVVAQQKMFRTPDHYGYFTLDYVPVSDLTFTANGTYTGKMLLQHYAGIIEKDREETSPVFLDLSLRAAYSFRVFSSCQLQVFMAVKNLLNAFQDDLDFGVAKDSKYFYGPASPRSIQLGFKWEL